MAAVLVDSNVLLDVITGDRDWRSWSENAIELAAERFRLVINPVIYAEVSIRFSRIEDLDFKRWRLIFSIGSRSHMRPLSWQANVLSLTASGVARNSRHCRTFSSGHMPP